METHRVASVTTSVQTRARDLTAGSGVVTTSKALQTQGFSITIGTLLPHKWPHCQNPTEHTANKKPRISGVLIGANG
jgi:hypothetical protein